MRITCYVPDGELTDKLLVDVLSLVCVTVQLETAARWTRLERVLASLKEPPVPVQSRPGAPAT